MKVSVYKCFSWFVIEIHQLTDDEVLRIEEIYHAVFG